MALILLFHEPEMQLFLLSLTTLIELCFMTFQGPFESKLANILSIINEIFFLVSLCFYHYFKPGILVVGSS